MLIIHFTDRNGEGVGPTVMLDVKPNIGEKVVFTNSKNKLTEARVIDVSHHIHFEQVKNKNGMNEYSSARVYVLLDLDSEQL